MKMKFTVILLLLITISLVAGATIEYINASSQGDNIKIEWKSLNETSLKNYVIERKTPQTPFVEIATIAPKGNDSYYDYIDETAYKTSSSLFFTYRLKAVDMSGQSSFSYEVSVSSNVSDVKRTWGQIKAMFR